MRTRLVVAALATVAGTLGLLAACSLDLDESLLDKKDGGTIILGDVVVPEGATVTESGVIENPTAGACTKDEECVSANACLKGRCDLARRACAFDVCRPAACSVGKCDETKRTCSDPTTYKLKAATFAIAQPLLCAGCLAAAYPWVFVGSQQGVLVYNVANPANESPVQVPITGIGFIPTRMARSGNRIWFAGNASGQQTGPIRLPVAYIDVPSDPFTKSLAATSVLVELKVPPQDQPRIFARENKTLLLIGPAPTFATSVLDATLAEGASLTPIGFSPQTNTDIFAVSGNRAVMMTNAPGVPNVNLVSDVGARVVTLEKSITMTDIGDTSSQRSFGWASGIDGTVFWAGAANGGAPETPVTRAIRGFFLTADAKSAIADPPKGTDIETYSEGLGANADAVRFPALIDNNTAMVATSAKEDLTRVAVNFVTRDPIAVKTDKRFVIPTAINTIVASDSSNGLGYFGVNEPKPNDAGAASVIGKVYVFDPACAP